MRLTTEQQLGPGEVAALYPRYRSAFEPLVHHAAARHVLTRREFAQEMADRRVDKLLVRATDDRIVAVATLTRDLEAIPWVNPHYYRGQFPDAGARNAITYLGYLFVDPEERRSEALHLVTTELDRRLSGEQGVLAYDVSAFNDAYGIGRRGGEILRRARTIVAVDTQTYYAADFRHSTTAPSSHPTAIGAVAGPLRHTTLAEQPGRVDELGALLESLRSPGPLLPAQPLAVGLDHVLGGVPPARVVLVEDGVRLRGAALLLPVRRGEGPSRWPARWSPDVERAARSVVAASTTADVVLLPLLPGYDVASPECLGAVVAAARRGAGENGPGDLLVLVRPASKRRYPLVPLPDYLAWKSSDGAVFDAALRLHVDLGAEVVSTTQAEPVTADRRRWEDCSALSMPGDGSYVIRGGLVPLVVRHGTGVYVEPRVWVRYAA